MNPLYIALPLFGFFVWILAVVVVRYDKKTGLKQQQAERSQRHHWVSRSGKRWR